MLRAVGAREERAARWVELSISKEDLGVNFTANVDNGIKGFAGVSVHSSTVPYCRLDMLHVNEDYRGRGIGQRLLDAAISDAREREFAFMLLAVSKTNEAAIHIYEKKGFKVVPSLRTDLSSLFLTGNEFNLMYLDLKPLVQDRTRWPEWLRA
ncbi:MAG TPA: GNAT family N-acetyltransferase [Candidatus Acidoferrum sp.]|nr:GNAT family N-acetyltransferase [Candidatus Acidoferrum sp.]